MENKTFEEEIIQKFNTEFPVIGHMHDEDCEFQCTFADEIKVFFKDSFNLHKQKILDALELDKNIQKHKDRAAILAHAHTYNDVTMPFMVEDPIVRMLVIENIDSVRKLSEFKQIIEKI